MKWNAWTKTIHWVSAVLIFVLIGTGIVMVHFLNLDFDLKFQQYQLHKSVGVVVFFTTIFRVLYRSKQDGLLNQHRVDSLEQTVARWVKWFFYFSLLAMPVLGWLSVSTAPLQIPTKIFGVFELPHVLSADESLHEVFRILHKVIGWVLAGTICLHISAALKHHFLDRDNTLIDMLPSTMFKHRRHKK